MRENLTNEQLFDKFNSPFNLVTHAIELAKQLSARGEEHANLANEVIEIIACGDDELYNREWQEQQAATAS